MKRDKDGAIPDLANIRTWSLEDLADAAGDPIDGNLRLYANAEISLRTAKAQIESTEAQKQLVKQTSQWVVIAMAVMTALTLFFQALSWLWPNPLRLH